MYIYLFIILGFILRINNIIKPEGLWNDEYVSWFVSSVPFNQGFFQEILKQCHMPLYYIYLKPFAECSDTVLRLTSVIPSLIAIPVMYIVGKEFSEKCAKYSALVTATLPFLVYYSQEVRFYSLLFLLSAIVLLFAIRILKNDNRKNVVYYSVFSILLIFTHVLGIIYISILTIYLLWKKKCFSWKVLAILFTVILLIIPLGLNILNQLPSSQWWGVFSYTNLMFLFSDFFSPVLTNNINAPGAFYYRHDLLFILLISIPTLISVIGLILGIKKFKGFLEVSLLYIFILSVLSITGKLVFITKYSIEILPVLILVSVYGLYNKNKLTRVLLYSLILINILAFMTPFYPSKQIRTEGHRLPCVVLNNQKPDYILFTYYAPDRFLRYIKTDTEMSSVNKTNRNEYNILIPAYFDKIKNGETLSVVFLDSVSFIPENYIEEAKNRNLPEMFITFSSIRHLAEKLFTNNFKDIKIMHAGSWTIINGVKK